MNVEDAQSDTRFNAHFDSLTGYKTRSVLCVPVRDHTHRVVAVVEAVNKIAQLKSPDHGESTPVHTIYSFSSHDEEILRACCDEIAVALKRFTMEMILYAEDASERAKKRSKASTQQKMFMDSFLATYSSVMSYQTLGWSRGSPRHSIAVPRGRKLPGSETNPSPSASFNKTAMSPPFLRQRRWSMTHISPGGAAEGGRLSALRAAEGFVPPPPVDTGGEGRPSSSASPSSKSSKATPDQNRRRQSSPCPASTSSMAIKTLTPKTSSPMLKTTETQASDGISEEEDSPVPPEASGDALLRVHTAPMYPLSSESEFSSDEEKSESSEAQQRVPRVADDHHSTLTLTSAGFLALRGRGSGSLEATDRAQRGLSSRRWIKQLGNMVNVGDRRHVRHPSPSVVSFRELLRAHTAKPKPEEPLPLLFSKGDGWGTSLWRTPDAWIEEERSQGEQRDTTPSLFGGTVPPVSSARSSIQYLHPHGMSICASYVHCIAGHLQQMGLRCLVRSPSCCPGVVLGNAAAVRGH